MMRLLSLLLGLALMASFAIPGNAVSRCVAANDVTIGCCPAPAGLVTCCCVEQPAPTPAVLPAVDRHWLVDEQKTDLTVSIAILWSHSPADAPTTAWPLPPVLPFGGGPPPRERFCIILI